MTKLITAVRIAVTFIAGIFVTLLALADLRDFSNEKKESKRGKK